MRWNIKLFILFILAFQQGNAQLDYVWPIDSPRVISGNYGELRPNHFHTGIDFSTNGKTDKPVYAIAEGYVSRIKISSVGYGKSIYITHPDGMTSVYAHLNVLDKKIAAVVKREQYAKKNFEIDYYPGKEELRINRKQVIGLSGNTGSSTGPHLHFEIRETKTEIPVNPLEHFHINDTVKPVLDRIAFYNLADTCSPKYLGNYKVKRDRSDNLKLEKDSIILTNGILGFAFCGYDKFEVKGSPNNIFAVKLYYDEFLVYAHSLTGIHFDELRFVNEFSEVQEKEKFRFQKCFMPTLYPNGIYQKRPTKGRILLSDTNFHQLKLQIYDDSGNENTLSFTFKTRKLNYYGKPSINSDVYAICTEDLMINKNKLQIYIPANTLYYSTGLIFENTLESSGKVIILPREANLRSTSIIGFEVPVKHKTYKDKLVLNSGSGVSTPIVKRDSVFYSVKTLGSFVLEADTIAPKIRTQVPLAKLTKLKGIKSIAFVVNDNLSGIGKYDLYINDKWVIAEFDAKNDLITYYFDEDTPKGVLNFKLQVSDKVKNSTELKFTLKN